MTDFFRFPRTPHILWLGKDAPRDDKVLTEEEVGRLLSGEVVVEEKLDGANLGFSVSSDGIVRAQNRGQFLTDAPGGQFERLPEWISIHGEKLADALGTRLIAFGEWCAARHSLDYPLLPDWWLIFDVYDKVEERFWCSDRRLAFAADTMLSSVPRLGRSKQTMESLVSLLTTQKSQFREGSLEGVVVRSEADGWLVSRGKLVRPDFVQSMESHWRGRKLEWNRVRW